MNENVFSHEELAGDFHPNHHWGKKLYKMFKTGKLEIVPLSKNHPGKTEYEVSYRHLKSGLYLVYSSRFIIGRGFRESVTLSHPETTPQNVRIFHSEDISELEIELDLQI
jgi:hypothetical protein